jgi:hypothetical protein
MVTLHVYVVLSKNKGSRCAEQQGLNVTYIILNLCCLAFLVYFIIEVTSAIIELYTHLAGHKEVDITPSYYHVDIKVSLVTLSLCESTLILVQFYLQTGIIYTANSFKLKTQVQSIDKLLNHLAMFNFAQWIVKSFLETHYKSHNINLLHEPDMASMWNSVVSICMPLMAYFHYISTFHLIRLTGNVQHDLPDDNPNNKDGCINSSTQVHRVDAHSVVCNESNVRHLKHVSKHTSSSASPLRKRCFTKLRRKQIRNKSRSRMLPTHRAPDDGMDENTCLISQP